MQKEACGRGQRQRFEEEPVDWTRLRSQRDVMRCGILLGSRRLCEESEETGGGGTDEAELDGERAGGAVAELLVARVGRAALAGGAGAGGRGGEGAGGGGARGGDGAVGLREGSGDSCGSGRSRSSGDLSVGSEGRRLGDGALDGSLDGLGDRAGSNLSTGGSALGGGGGSGSLDGRGDSGGDLGVLGGGRCDSSRGLGSGGYSFVSIQCKKTNGL